ncbi:hypothetical protein AOLI_G00114340 [Acnodon oligacanthus]
MLLKRETAGFVGPESKELEPQRSAGDLPVWTAAFASLEDYWVLCWETRRPALALDNTDVWADAIWGSENKTGMWGGAAWGIQSGDLRI